MQIRKSVTASLVNSLSNRNSLAHSQIRHISTVYFVTLMETIRDLRSILTNLGVRHSRSRRFAGEFLITDDDL